MYNASLPTRGAWIEIYNDAVGGMYGGLSLPTRGAWIEMSKDCQRDHNSVVAPHTGSVD